MTHPSGVSGCSKVQCPQSLRRKQGSLMNGERKELLVGRFPILPREKQIQFLFIHLLVPASMPPGFLESMANLSPLLSSSLPWFWSLLEFAEAAAADHLPSISTADSQFAAKEN